MHSFVFIQDNAWCDERVMAHWVKTCWKPNVKEEAMLVLDVHKAQMTDNIKSALLRDCNTTPVYVPPGCTSLVQPLDVVVNAPFKKKIETCAMQHVQDNLEQYLNGKFTASERRVLLTGWIGQAWEEISSNKKMIERSFKKCGISVAADGSEDSEIHIEGLEEYTIEVDSSSEEESLFAESDTDPFASDDEESAE